MITMTEATRFEQSTVLTIWKPLNLLLETMALTTSKKIDCFSYREWDVVISYNNNSISSKRRYNIQKHLLIFKQKHDFILKQNLQIQTKH